MSRVPQVNFPRGCVAVCLIANANVHGSGVSLSELNKRLVPNLPEQQEPNADRHWLCREARKHAGPSSSASVQALLANDIVPVIPPLGCDGEGRHRLFRHGGRLRLGQRGYLAAAILGATAVMLGVFWLRSPRRQ
jgi:hypothetical protein